MNFTVHMNRRSFPLIRVTKLPGYPRKYVFINEEKIENINTFSLYRKNRWLRGNLVTRYEKVLKNQCFYGYHYFNLFGNVVTSRRVYE